MPSVAADDHRGRRRGWMVAGGAVLAATAVTWYAWPGVTGNRGDVAVLGDASFSGLAAPLTAEVRARGRDLEVLPAATDWCSVAESARQLRLPHDTAFLVLALGARGDCPGDPVAEVVDVLDARSIAAVIVVSPGDTPPDTSARTVPVEQLLGAPGTVAMPCEWWDECTPSGTVDVRSADGGLTDVGFDRIARMVAATVG